MHRLVLSLSVFINAKGTLAGNKLSSYSPSFKEFCDVELHITIPYQTAELAER